MLLSDEVKESILQHTIREYPKEMCGVVVENKDELVFISIPNISHKYELDSNGSFIIDPNVYSSIEGMYEIKAIVHSHPDCTSTPSVHDTVRCNQGTIPWVICSYPEVDISITHPKDDAPLIGRDFVHGVQDCYTLIKDYYEVEYQIVLGEYEREDEWWMKGKDYYIDNFSKEGFYEVDNIEVGDLLLMQIESPVTNHAAIMYEDNIILHHLYGRPSCLSIYGGYWRDRTTRVLRHRGKHEKG